MTTIDNEGVEDPPMTMDAPYLCMRLGVNVRRLRKERKWTFKVTSGMTGIHSRHLQKIEVGDTNLSLWSLARLARGFGVDACELLEP
jgi:transcriptional regulator with XRE-family HTH domain